MQSISPLSASIEWPIHPTHSKPGCLENAGSGSGLCAGWEPSSPDGHKLQYPEEDIWYLNIVCKDRLSTHWGKEWPLSLEWGRRLNGSMKIKSDCLWTMGDFGVPKLWRMVTEFKYGLSCNIQLMLFRRRSPKYCPFQAFETADMVDKWRKQSTSYRITLLCIKTMSERTMGHM